MNDQEPEPFVKRKDEYKSIREMLLVFIHTMKDTSDRLNEYEHNSRATRRFTKKAEEKARDILEQL